MSFKYKNIFFLTSLLFFFPFFYSCTPAPSAYGFKRQYISLHSPSGKRERLLVELAENALQRSQGLMYRQELKDGAGMLFIFEREDTLSFWMKNTYIPLSIAFFSETGLLIDIQEGKPLSTEHIVSRRPARYALEVPLGWFEKKDLKLGTVLSGYNLRD